MVQVDLTGRAKYQQPRAGIWMALGILLKRMRPRAMGSLLLHVPTLFDILVTQIGREANWAMAECIMYIFECLQGEVQRHGKLALA